jgi:alkanesulfonate monooxygenase SsuD/methylene tetrahydromethanopterin reductase-like flavin-dependent oxidoreductase (luciferase family)
LTNNTVARWFSSSAGTQSEARSRFAETLEVVLQGITQGRLDFHGRYYQFDDVTLGWCETAQRPMPPLRYARTLSNAAEHGMNGLSLPAQVDGV